MHTRTRSARCAIAAYSARRSAALTNVSCIGSAMPYWAQCAHAAIPQRHRQRALSRAHVYAFCCSGPRLPWLSRRCAALRCTALHCGMSSLAPSHLVCGFMLACTSVLMRISASSSSLSHSVVAARFSALPALLRVQMHDSHPHESRASHDSATSCEALHESGADGAHALACAIALYPSRSCVLRCSQQL
jgi:hypothetical protein